MIADTSARAPCTATPAILNGSNRSQTNGYRTSARIANGQHRTNRMHQSRKAIIIASLGRYVSPPWQFPKNASLFIEGRFKAETLFDLGDREIF